MSEIRDISPRRRRCHAHAAWVGLSRLMVATVLGLAALPVQAQQEGEFIRIARAPDGTALALQTAIVRLERASSAAADKLVVDLVSAVHIADTAYYQTLNARFAEYDAVLYELVAPAGTRVPAGGGEHDGLVSGTQLAMTRLLELSFQLDHVDYTRPNFVHADLSPQEVASSMRDRGESVSQYLVKLFALSMSEQARDPYGLGSIGLLAALFSPERARVLKNEFAIAMLDMESVAFLFEGDSGSTIVGERNRRAVAVLAERIALGDRHIAVFYGAAHMPDMLMRLENELAMSRVDGGVEWLDAWDLR